MKTIALLAPLTALLAVLSLGSFAPMARADDAQAGNSTTTSSSSADLSAASSGGGASSEHQTMQAECFERGQLLFDLAKDQGERLSQTKHFGENGLLEAFTSPTEGTWTIVYSDSDKRSCIIASGNGLPIVEDNSAEDARVPKKVEAQI